MINAKDAVAARLRDFEPRKIVPYDRLPPVRYVGSKRRVLPVIEKIFRSLEFESCLDLFTGSGSVAWTLKALGKQVHANDQMRFSSIIASSIIANPLDDEDLVQEVVNLAHVRGMQGTVASVYRDILFNEEDSLFLDGLSNTWARYPIEIQTLIQASASIACLKKRPRGLFTQMQVNASKAGTNTDESRPLRELYLRSVHDILNSRIKGKRTTVTNIDALEIDSKKYRADLLYLDPPYPSRFSDSDYLRRYHFLEGYVRNWKDVSFNFASKVRLVRLPQSRIDHPNYALGYLRSILEKYLSAHWVISYSSNVAFPMETLESVIKSLGRKTIFYKTPLAASHGTKKQTDGTLNNQVEEYFIVAEKK